MAGIDGHDIAGCIVHSDRGSREVTFTRTWSGHEFSDTEINQLLSRRSG